MGAFKEEAHVIEDIAKKQTRIYNDAADYGLPYDIKNPRKDIKELIRVLREFKALDKKYPDEKLFVRNRQVWGDKKTGGVSLDVIIFWEKDEGFYMGTKYHISFNVTPKHPSLINKECNGFISVDISPHKEK
jgi:hypothetical protein